MFLNNKRHFVSCSAVLLLSVLSSFSAWSGELYKWVDKKDQTHYSQVPPQKNQVKKPTKKSDSITVSAKRKGNYVYCGGLKLPGPQSDSKSFFSKLENSVESWTSSLKRSEYSLTTQLRSREKNDQQNNMYREIGFDYTDIAGDRRKTTVRTIKEYRCALAWADIQKNKYSDTQQDASQEKLQDLKGAESNYMAAFDAAHKECGFEPKDYTDSGYNNKKAEWKQCMQPHDKRIRLSERNLRKLKGETNKFD